MCSNAVYDGTAAVRLNEAHANIRIHEILKWVRRLQSFVSSLPEETDLAHL